MAEPVGTGEGRGAALGQMADAVHRMPIRVYWEDTDAGGIVYYANYLKFTERARSDLLRALEIDQQAMLAPQDGSAGTMFAVRDVRAEYLSPARLDDDLTVETRLEDMRGATLTLSQDVIRDGTLLFRSSVRAAFIGLDGRPRRVPGAVRDKMRTLADRA